MRYLALAADYDGTASHHGKLSDSAAAALERVRASGRRVILVTGRRVDDLLHICPRTTLFDMVVAENGAVLYDPRRREETPLAPSLPAQFAERLRARGVPVEAGTVIVATHDHHMHSNENRPAMRPGGAVTSSRFMKDQSQVPG